jgi:hypothetical protein
MECLQVAEAALPAPLARRETTPPPPTAAGPSCVLRTGNEPRVRDGYISESTRGHARALPTHSEGPICRTNVPAHGCACTPLPPLDFHGKEGVDGSSPSEGLPKVPANRHFVVVCSLNTRTDSGHILVRVTHRDVLRRLLTRPEMAEPPSRPPATKTSGGEVSSGRTNSPSGGSTSTSAPTGSSRRERLKALSRRRVARPSTPFSFGDVTTVVCLRRPLSS